ncbi:MAG: OPT/YSL family transporter [Kofleriaceae bacterium]|nr:OPT/YSL family transporter [Kofleriaceae bacterium]
MEPLPDTAQRRGSEINVRVLIASAVVAAIMGASYPYMVLKLGFGPNVSVVAAFLGYLFLNLLGHKQYDRWQNNIVQTAGTSAAQTAFMCVLLGAFDILRESSHGKFAIELTPLTSFLWLTTACTLGVLLAVPLRQHFIVDEKLPFADGLATAETLVVLDPPRRSDAGLMVATAEVRSGGDAVGMVGATASAGAKLDENRFELLASAARHAAMALMFGVVLSAALMVFREDGHLSIASIPEGWASAAVVSTVVLAKMGVGISYSVLSVGSGMLIGLRVCASMLLGGLLGWVIMPGLLVDNGVIPANPGRNAVLTWVMWPATGMLVAGGLTALALRWRVLIRTFASLRSAKIDGDDFPLKWVGMGVVACTVLLCVVQKELLGMPIWATLLATVASIPLMLVGLRVLGETGWGPISALSNMMQGLFAAIAPGNTVANMVSSGTTGTIATSSEAIMQDYKAGYIINSTPRAMTIVQLLAVPIGAAAVSWMYPLFVRTYGLIDQLGPTGEVIKKAELSSPISKKWAYFAQLLEQGFSALPSSTLWALGAFAVLGVILTVLEDQPKLKKWVPSPTGIGIGILVPFSVISTMFIGGVVATVWFMSHRKSHEKYATPLASGLIAGEALAAVALSVYLYGRDSGWF